MTRQFTGLATLGVAVALTGCTYETGDEGTPAVMDQQVTLTCSSNNGIHPTKAALAVAMANEVGRWDPVADLTVTWDRKVALSSTGESRCRNGCPNTKAILGLQDVSTTLVIDQSVFNPTALREDLIASFDRQRSHTQSLTLNSPSLLPEDHVLVKVGGPLSLGTGACGPHYLYKPFKPDGSPLKYPANLANALVFFGIYSGNNYLAFTTYNGDVAIDPTDGDNATPVTTSGSCPTYENDRVYNPSGSLLNTCCVSVNGGSGLMQAIVRAPGYLGCKVGATLTTTTTTSTSTEPCTPTKTFAVTAGGTGNFNTTGAYCAKVTGTINGWNCYNFTGRTVLANDKSVACAATLPAKVNDAYYFEVSAGTYSWASIAFW